MADGVRFALLVMVCRHVQVSCPFVSSYGSMPKAAGVVGATDGKGASTVDCSVLFFEGSFVWKAFA